MQTLASIAVVTRSESMHAVLARVDTIARSDTTVLLVGETGVGKELFADYIHRVSPRGDRPFVKIAPSAMPHDLLESELFGHERGAFTSALTEKRGLFELAHTGTLFLDDVDDVPPNVQAKLLRVLESQQVMRVGGTTTIPIDVRLVTASKVDLKELVQPEPVPGRPLPPHQRVPGASSRRCATAARTCRCWSRISCGDSPPTSHSP